MIKRPSDLNELRVIPISDTHIGDKNFKEKELREKLYTCRYVPTIILLAGDLVNNGIKCSVSNCYEEIIPAGDPQINHLVSLLSPYKNDIGLIVPGNHELRSTKEVNIDVARIYADRLGAQYASPHALLKIQFGTNSKGDPINYILYMHHGSGGGKARSGKTKRMIDQEWMVDGADIYLRAHTHVNECFSTASIQFDERTMAVKTHVMYHVSTGTWLDTSEYAERMELPPLPIGSPEIMLSGREKKIEVKI
jgi:hypothetical protein